MLNFFNNIQSQFDVIELAEQYKHGIPMPHVIIDNFLPTKIFTAICKEIKTYPDDKWIYRQLPDAGVRKESRDFSHTPTLQNFTMNLTAHSFITWMNNITGTADTIPDPHFLGAGITSQPAGSYLGTHVDFNWNNTLKLNRKFNLILYANEVWESSWNGQLEFWNKDKTECMLSVEPSPNRLIFWEYEQDLIHGFSQPLKCPADVDRQNVMAIYYYSDSTPVVTPHKSQFY